MGMDRIFSTSLSELIKRDLAHKCILSDACGPLFIIR